MEVRIICHLSDKELKVTVNIVRKNYVFSYIIDVFLCFFAPVVCVQSGSCVQAMGAIIGYTSNKGQRKGVNLSISKFVEPT